MEGGDFGRFNHLFVCLFTVVILLVLFIFIVIIILSFFFSLIGEAKMTHFSGVSHSHSHSLKRVEKRTTTRRLLFGRIKISDYSFKVFRR